MRQVQQVRKTQTTNIFKQNTHSTLTPTLALTRTLTQPSQKTDDQIVLGIFPEVKADPAFEPHVDFHLTVGQLPNMRACVAKVSCIIVRVRV